MATAWKEARGLTSERPWLKPPAEQQTSLDASGPICSISSTDISSVTRHLLKPPKENG